MPDIDNYSESALENRLPSVARLKGYSRETKSYGVTHITWEEKASVISYFLIYSVSAMVEVMDTSKHAYFDSESGELLGHNEDEAAKAANNKAIRLARQGRFSEAHRQFDMAYNVCEYGNSDESSYTNSRDAMNLASEAKACSYSGRYAEAVQKYDDAYNLSNVREVYQVFEEHRDLARQKAEQLEMYRLERERAEEEHRKKDAEEKRRKEEIERRQKERERAEEERRKKDAEEKRRTEEELGRQKAVQGIWQRLTSKIWESQAERSRKLRENWRTTVREAQGRNESAQKLFQDGQRMWEEGWAAEENDEPEEATKKFAGALKAFEGCADYVKEAKEKYADMTRLKITGNEQYNDGVELQEQGNAFQDADDMLAKFEKAEAKFQEAIKSYSKGLAMGDQRFGLSKELVEDSIKELKGGIESVQTQQMAQALSQLTHLSQVGPIQILGQVYNWIASILGRRQNDNEFFMHA